MHEPSEDELRRWAYSISDPPAPASWEHVLSWRMERGLLRLVVELASDPDCPAADYFLGLLYTWVNTVAKDDEFEIRRSLYDEWLDVARGCRDSKVKKWRREARTIFQGQKQFDREKWWEHYSSTATDVQP